MFLCSVRSTDFWSTVYVFVASEESLESTAIYPVYSILVSCTKASSPTGRSSAQRLAAWSKKLSLASLDSFRFCLAASISSRRRCNCLSQAGISDAVSSIPWFQLALCHVKFTSSMGSIASRPNRRGIGEYLVVCLMVILSAQRTTGRW